ncbi:lipid-A-disaccharide kinase [Polaromonas sp. OV174]|uniref:tetraacyldisaccharide 4'-kinase n=1 Tax=Polaromonas sp. OV174 TaxID=1855300 RepID=UPI0008E03D2B|nr:tetraacyldisaccharide 4'-kinase [Polaromonas sp. OV174]SFC56747.1 lipid-A-disaccharide kinase [Polaromonas sp. OV174]
MKQLLPRAWLTRGWLACLLWPLAQVHGLLVRLRLLMYRSGLLPSERFRVPVIVVGNVVAGGAGKTPLVISLVRHLQAQGLAVGVLSRGYGRSGQGSLEVRPETPINESGDEPALIRRATDAPVFVARKRPEALRSLLAAYPASTVVVCDDGLQHYALQRDIEIAVFDDRGVGNGWLLPAGPLREPWPERQRQGLDLVLHTGQQPAFEGFTSSRQLADHAQTADGRQIALSALRGRPLVALAGIASPESFFGMLRTRGLTLAKTIPLPDHHDFEHEDLSAYTGQTVLCTEKDAVKLFAIPGLAGLELLAIPLVFSPEPAFFVALDALLRPKLSQLPSEHGHQTT